MIFEVELTPQEVCDLSAEGDLRLTLEEAEAFLEENEAELRDRLIGALFDGVAEIMAE